MVDRQGLVVGVLSLVETAQRLERATLVVGDGGIAGIQALGSVEGGQCQLVLTQH
jgi:hypothetical protein